MDFKIILIKIIICINDNVYKIRVRNSYNNGFNYE